MAIDLALDMQHFDSGEVPRLGEFFSDFSAATFGLMLLSCVALDNRADNLDERLDCDEELLCEFDLIRETVVTIGLEPFGRR